MSTPRPALIALGAVVLVWALALPVAPLDTDAAEYAHIACSMLDSGSFLVIHKRGVDYLDKPPLTFWLTALSFATFGVSAAASKLASLLGALLGTFATYRLVRLDASERAATLAALFLASSQALFMITNDCRTDTVLLGTAAFALWQARAHLRDRTTTSLLLCGLGVGLAMLAKGPIGAAIVLFAVGSELVLERRFRAFFSPRPLVVAALALLVLAPMLVGLHRQFGLDGWTFFFWTQSFGRITGANAWRDDTSPLFFTHTLLWTFLPWTPFVVPALARAAIDLVRARLRPGRPGEAFLAGGFALTFVALSLSHYKLPHYLFVTFPLAAALTGRWADRALDDARIAKRLEITGLLLVAAFVVVAALVVIGFPRPPAWVAVVAIALFAGAFALARTRHRVLGPPLAGILAVNVVLSGHFYPSLVRYQSGTEAVRLAEERGIPKDRIAAYRAREYSLDFGVARDLTEFHHLEDLAHAEKPLWLYTDEPGLAELLATNLALGPEIALAEYHVTKLNGRFLAPATRAATLQTRYLIELRGPSAAR